MEANQNTINEQILDTLKNMSSLLNVIVGKLTKDDDPNTEEELGQDEYLKLKEKYWNLYYTDIEGYEFMYRDLTRNEFKVISKFDNDAAAEEYICSTCLILPKAIDFDDMPAGIPSILAAQIINKSGFDPSDSKTLEYLMKYRDEMGELENQISCFIHEAFPNMSIEEIDDLSLEKTMWFYSRAEHILNTIQGRELPVITALTEVAPVQQDFVSPDSVSGDLDDPIARQLKAFLEGKNIFEERD